MDFKNFGLNNNKMYKEYDLPTWYFTKDLNYAKSYGSVLYSVKLNINNTFDTSNKKHYDMFIAYLEEDGKTEDEISDILDEQFYKELPYWTCADAYYCAISNNFDSIVIAEELEKEVESIAVFDSSVIQILEKKKI
jgi:hypothetical protein